MKQLIKINGIKEIEGMKFHDIEGGFGEGKKAMLVKEIASIHGRDVGRINEAINRNRKRFKDGTDIIDLRWTEVAIDLCVSGIYTQNSINASSNIYLLSERGYAKLLKILEDDMAWEQYEKLVDGYFNMRADMKEQSKPTCIEDLIIMQAQSLKDMREQVNQANYHALEAKAEAEKSREEIQAMRDAITLDSNGWRKETTAIINKIATKLGGFSEVNLLKREIYKLLDTRLGVDVNRRLLEKKKRMALEGVCKSKIDKVNVLDVIAEDKKLIDGYVNII
ncbi:MAG: hypothetical protein DBY38_03620, partial [Clostridium cadaveris]